MEAGEEKREDRREIDYEAAPLNLFSRRLPGAAPAIPVWPPTVMNASFCLSSPIIFLSHPPSFLGKKCNTVNIGHLTPGDPPTAQRALSRTFSGRLCQPILLIRAAHKKGDKGIKCSGRSRTKREKALTSVTT